MRVIFGVLLLAIGSEAGISSGCLDCICHVEGCKAQAGKCRMDRGSLSCGPFQIKRNYWCDANRIFPCGPEYEQRWKKCAIQMSCSVEVVKKYMARYGTHCTGGRTPTCEDYARIHNGGPHGCTRASTLGYWHQVQACCRLIPCENWFHALVARLRVDKM